jgi:hypothetical protein
MALKLAWRCTSVPESAHRDATCCLPGSPSLLGCIQGLARPFQPLRLLGRGRLMHIEITSSCARYELPDGKSSHEKPLAREDHFGFHGLILPLAQSLALFQSGPRRPSLLVIAMRRSWPCRNAPPPLPTCRASCAERAGGRGPVA